MDHHGAKVQNVQQHLQTLDIEAGPRNFTTSFEISYDKISDSVISYFTIIINGSNFFTLSYSEQTKIRIIPEKSH